MVTKWLQAMWYKGYAPIVTCVYTHIKTECRGTKNTQVIFA